MIYVSHTLRPSVPARGNTFLVSYAPPIPRVPARGTPTMDERANEAVPASMVGVPLAGTLGRGQMGVSAPMVVNPAPMS